MHPTKVVLFSFLLGSAMCTRRNKRSRFTPNTQESHILPLVNIPSPSAQPQIPTSTYCSSSSGGTAHSLDVPKSSGTTPSLDVLQLQPVQEKNQFTEIKKLKKSIDELVGLANSQLTHGIIIHTPQSPEDRALLQLQAHSKLIYHSETLQEIFKYVRFIPKALGNPKTFEEFRANFISRVSSPPEQILSLDFANAKILKLSEAIEYSNLQLKLFDPERTTIKSPAIYLLNAVLQLDSMLHRLLSLGHPPSELQYIVEQREALIQNNLKYPHYETARDVVKVSFSKTVRNVFYPETDINVNRIIETVDRILSDGAVPEFRAYFYAKCMTTVLLAEDAVELEMDVDEITAHQPYAAPGFSLWFGEVLSIVSRIAPARCHEVMTRIILSKNLKCILNTADYF